MSKRIGLLCSLALVVALAPAASAGAVAKPPESCSVLKGAMSFKPPLPTGANDSAAVKPTITFKAKISQCTGPVNGSGVVTFTKKLTVAINCEAQNPKWFAVTEHIKWSDGHTSTVAAMVPWAVASDSFNGPVKAGAFRGRHQVTRLRGSVPRGSCVSRPLASEKVQLAVTPGGREKFVIK